MRYLIDSNIVLFLLSDKEMLSMETAHIIENYGNRIYVSSESINEIIYLLQRGKIIDKRLKTPENIIDIVINDLNFEIKYVKEEHLRTLAKLPFFDDHKDPCDRTIIAQAITEKIPVVSSDRKFDYYKKYGLDFIFNKR